MGHCSIGLLVELRVHVVIGSITVESTHHGGARSSIQLSETKLLSQSLRTHMGGGSQLRRMSVPLAAHHAQAHRSDV